MDKEIAQQFDELGIEPSSDVIAKSLDLCVSYRIDDAAEFVEQWIAFSKSQLNGAEPTTEYLNEFERKVFQTTGETVCTFGNPTLISNAQWASLNQPKVHLRQLLLHNDEALSSNKSQYMFDTLRGRSEIGADRLLKIGERLCIKHFGSEAADYELTEVDVHSQDMIKTIGTICCDHDGPLDASSTQLTGSVNRRTVQLDFSKMKSIGVFPGQVVLVTGMNPKGDVIMVEEIVAECQLEPPTPPKFSDQLSFVIAAGPYTYKDNLVYEPLHDLICYCKDHKPDVLIMTGPFLEADHKLSTEHLSLAESFESFFEKKIAGIVEAIGTATTLLIVSSHRDSNGDPVFPTMPLALRKSYPNVHTLPDPSLVDLNGITIGITSTDVVEHLISHELAVKAGDKVKRVVNYLLNQGSFYPLRPAVEDEMRFDSYFANKYANIEQIPNILILPSDQKCFVRDVNGCLAINPGRLAPKTGGTFARFIITPPEQKDETNLFNYVGCQIRKV